MKNILILLLFPAFLTAQPVYTYWHGYADVTVTATYGNDSIVVAVDEGTFAGGAYQTGNHTLSSFPFSSLVNGGLKAWFVCNLFQITRYNPVTQRVTLFNLDKPNQLVPSGVFRVFMLEETENALGDVVGMFPIFADGNGSGAMTGINPFEAACIINHYSLRAAGGSIAKDPTLDGIGSVLQPLKIAQQGAAIGEVLIWDGSTWTPGSVGGSGLVDGEFGDIGVIADPLEFYIIDDKVDGVKVLDESLTGDDILDESITSAELATASVQADEIDTDAVGAAEIAANAVGSSEIATDAVGSAEIAANAVGTAEIADGAVTMPKIAQSGATTGQVLEWNGTAWVPSTDDTGAGGGGGVTSFNTRTGAVTAASGDYTAAQITNTPAGNIAATTVQAALNELDTEKVGTASSAGGDLSGTFSNLQIGPNTVGASELSSTTVAAGTYTFATVVVDEDGRVTSASSGTEADGSITNEGSLSVGTGGANTSTINSNTSGSGTVTLSGSSSVSVTESANTITVAVATSGIGATELGASGVTPGAYTLADVTVDADGRVTAAANGTEQDPEFGSWFSSVPNLDTDATDDLTTATNFGGDVSGIYSNIQLAANSVGASEITAGAVGTSEIADGSIAADDLGAASVTAAKLNQMSATAGQVLKWSGTAWAPATDDTGGGGGGSPGGSTGQVQYNNAGAFAGEADLFWDATNNRLGIGTSSPIKPLHVIASAENNGVAIGENDALNLMSLGYDNTNNRGAIQSYDNGSASHLNINPTGGNLGIGINAAPAYKIDQMNGVARFCFSSSGFTPYVNSSASFQRNSTYNYLEVRSNGGRDLLGSGSGVGYLQHEGTSEMQFWNATTIGGTAYQRFAIPNGSGGLLKQFVGGSTAGASSTETRVPGSIFAITANGAVSNTTTETTVLGTAAGTKTLPTNFFSAAGSTCRVTVCGTITNTGTPTLDLKLKYGSTVIASTGATTLVGITGTGNFTATFMVTCRTTGASGTVRASGTLTYFSTGTTPNLVQFADQNTTINTTTSNAIDLTATWSIADASNTATGTISVVEIIY